VNLRIDGWRKGIRFSASHLIPGHEQCGHMHGHTYAMHAVIGGEPVGHGFIVDFNEVVAILKGLADRFDHRLLLPTRNERIEIKESADEIAFFVGSRRYVLPRDDVELLPLANVSAENLADHVCGELARALAGRPNLRRVEAGVDEGYGKGAWAERVL